jgi:hypothetical protein
LEIDYPAAKSVHLTRLRYGAESEIEVAIHMLIAVIPDFVKLLAYISHHNYLGNSRITFSIVLA